MEPTKPRSHFTRFAKATSWAAGQPAAFFLAAAIIIAWVVSGPVFGFSDTWQLVINTGTTVVTFLMVFLIQSTQNRHAKAVQVKLDELIRVSKGAHVALLDLEELEDDELNIICTQYRELAERARRDLRRGKPDTNVPKIKPDNSAGQRR